MTFLRWQAPEPNRRGFHPGVFALVNGLAFNGLLSPAQEHFRRTTNDWFHANLPDPGIIRPSVYDRAINPTAAAWFKSTAVQFLAKIPGYLDILRSHNIACELVQTGQPGKVLYEDLCQVIAAPRR